MLKATKAAMVMCWVVFIILPATGRASQLGPDAPWPAISLPLPADPVARHYLGVKENDAFTVGDMAAEVVIVQIFSMYCPICQREAPRVNQLYTLIDKHGNVSSRLKIIGIGAGNSNFEVDFYRRSYKVPFPLFADGDFKIHEKVGEVRTPHFFILKREENGQARVVYVHSGGFKSPEGFLEEIVKRCGLE